MRIPLTKKWLAVVATLGIGRARGAGRPALVFSNQSFAEFSTFGGKSAPVLILASLNQNSADMGVSVPLSRTFTWTTRQHLPIDYVSLYVLDESTNNPNLIGTGTAAGQDHKNQDHDGNGSNNSMGLPIPEPTMMSRPTTSPTGTKKNLPSVPAPSSFEPEVKRQAGGAIDPFKQETVVLDVISGPTQGSVTIRNVTELARYSKSTLYFKAVWPNETGESYSRRFAVVNTVDEASEITQPGSQLFNSTPVFAEVNNNESPTSTFPTERTQAPTTYVGDPNAISSKGGEGGLSTGAIIGIAVACGILGLLLVLGGIWFLIRRRNKQSRNTHLGSPGRPYGAERSRTEDLIAEKEASAGGASDPSPHSPYSDDGVVLVPSGGGGAYHHNGGPPGVALGTPVAAPVLPQQIPRLPQPHDHHHHQQLAGPYAPYSDRGSIGGIGGGGGSPSTHAASIVHSTTNEEARAGMGSPATGRATPHSSLAPQYQHLVEEGMTEDEIRRLEDEERQLDAEIERAGRR